MHQSPFRPLIQFSKRACMYGGCHCSSRAAREQPLAELHRLDEPLAAGDDLERTIALLVELHRVGDRARVAEQVAGLAQHLDDLDACLRRRQSGELVVVLLRPRRRRSIPSRRSPHVTGLNAPLAWMIARTGSCSSRHQMTSVTSPKVQIIAAPVPFSGSASACALTGTRTPNSGVIDLGAEQRLIARIVGVRHDRDAGRDQLGPRGVDLDEASPAVRRRAAFGKRIL